MENTPEENKDKNQEKETQEKQKINNLRKVVEKIPEPYRGIVMREVNKL